MSEEKIKYEDLFDPKLNDEVKRVRLMVEEVKKGANEVQKIINEVRELINKL